MSRAKALYDYRNQGRGEQATLDMKRRVAALKAGGHNVLDALWERMVRAEAGEGYHYGFADEPAAQAVSGRAGA